MNGWGLYLAYLEKCMISHDASRWGNSTLCLWQVDHEENKDMGTSTKAHQSIYPLGVLGIKFNPEFVLFVFQIRIRPRFLVLPLRWHQEFPLAVPPTLRGKHSIGRARVSAHPRVSSLVLKAGASVEATVSLITPVSMDASPTSLVPKNGWDAYSRGPCGPKSSPSCVDTVSATLDASFGS